MDRQRNAVNHEALGSNVGLNRGKVFPASHAQSLLNPARRLVQSPRRTVAAIGLRPRTRVLELGCGPGFFTPSLVRAAAGGRVLLVDLQTDMLRHARQRLGRHSAVTYVQADGTALPVPDASFDAVFAATVLGEIPDHHRCLTEARRVLRPHGVLAVAETRRDSDFIAFGHLRALVEPVGFEFMNRRGSRWQYIARFQRT